MDIEYIREIALESGASNERIDFVLQVFRAHGINTREDLHRLSAEEFADIAYLTDANAAAH